MLSTKPSKVGAVMFFLGMGLLIGGGATGNVPLMGVGLGTMVGGPLCFGIEFLIRRSCSRKEGMDESTALFDLETQSTRVTVEKENISACCFKSPIYSGLSTNNFSDSSLASGTRLNKSGIKNSENYRLI